MGRVISEAPPPRRNFMCFAMRPTNTFGFTTWVVVVPVTVQISGEFTAQAGAKISYDWEKATLVGEIPVSTSLALKAFGGVGVGKVAGAGAYGSAKLALDMAFLRDPFVRKVDLTGELGVKAYVGPFEYARAICLQHMASVFLFQRSPCADASRKRGGGGK